MRFVKVILASMVAGIVVFGLARFVSAQMSHPPLPAWINADGTTDFSKMPDCIPIVDQTGKLSVDAKGQPRCLPKQKLMEAPPPPPQTGAEQSQSPVVPKQVIPVELQRP